MSARRRTAVALAVLAAGIAPGAAFAQSGGAGDDQYVDPIGGSQQQNAGGGSKGSGSPGGSSNGPSLSATPQLNAQSSQPAAPAPTATSAQQLPRTGLDAGAVAAIGLALLLAGAALRIRLRHARL